MKEVAKYLTCLFIFIFFASCRETTTTSPEPTDTILKLKKSTNEHFSMNYKYDNNLLVSMNFLDHDTSSGGIKFYYNANNKIIRCDNVNSNLTVIGYYSLYEYDADMKLVSEKDYSLKSDGNYELKQSLKFECDAAGRAIKAYDQGTNKVTCMVNYDTDGNVTERYCYKDGQLTEKVTYEYDKNLNPFNNVPLLAIEGAAESTSKNSIIKVVTIYYSGTKKSSGYYIKPMAI